MLMHFSLVISRFSIFGLVLFVAACSGGEQLRFETPEAAYSRGLALYEEEEYPDAIRAFQSVFEFGRGHEWGDDTQLYLARAHYGNREFYLASSEYTRFIELYQGEARVPEAEFERALCHYSLSPGFALDQTETEQAITFFRLFITRYPAHARAESAANYIEELRNKLGEKRYREGQNYVRLEYFEAAALTFEQVLGKYSDTRWVEPALVEAMRAYIRFSDLSIDARKKERLDKAVGIYTQFIQLFPNSDQLREAEDLYAEAQDKLAAIQGTQGS